MFEQRKISLKEAPLIFNLWDNVYHQNGVKNLETNGRWDPSKLAKGMSMFIYPNFNQIHPNFNQIYPDLIKIKLILILTQFYPIFFQIYTDEIKIDLDNWTWTGLIEHNAAKKKKEQKFEVSSEEEESEGKIMFKIRMLQTKIFVLKDEQKVWISF